MQNIDEVSEFRQGAINHHGSRSGPTSKASSQRDRILSVTPTSAQLAVCSIASAPRREKRPHQVFRHARPCQFKATGRKRRLVAKRMERLTKVLAKFDHTGDCKRIWASAETILRHLQESERRREPGDRLTWSRPTLFRYLQRLQKTGIASKGTLTRRRGSRIRSLHPEKLIIVRRESETPTKRESETEEVKDFELHKSEQRTDPRKTSVGASPCQGKDPRKQNQDQKHQPPVPVRGWTIDKLLEPESAVKLLNALHDSGTASNSYMASHLFMWSLRPTANDPDQERIIFWPYDYVIGVAENFLRTYSLRQMLRIFERFKFVSDYIPGVEFDGRRWVVKAGAAR